MGKPPAALMEELLVLCPGFAEAWDDEGELWCEPDGSRTFHGLLTVLSHHVAELLEEGKVDGLRSLFEWVERQLAGPDPSLADAVQTSFLGNLMKDAPERFSKA